MLQPGAFIRVRYRNDHRLLHERLLLCRSPVRETRWGVLTPDGDAYLMDIDWTSLSEIVMYASDRVPRQLNQLASHTFASTGFIPTPAEIQEATTELARRLASESSPRVRMRKKQAHPGAYTALDDEAPTPRGKAEAPCALVEAPRPLHAPAMAGGTDMSSLTWVACESRGGFSAGQQIPPDQVRGVRIGQRGLLLGTDNQSVLCEGCDAAAAPALADRLRAAPEVLVGDEPDLDARVMAISRTADGRRFLAFKEGVRSLVVSEWEHWPLTGPRTLRWCLEFIAEHDDHPKARHLKWRTQAGLHPGDVGVSEHESCLRSLEMAVTFDQLQASELACLEIVARRAQMVELKYRDKVIKPTDYHGDPYDDEHLFMGTGQTRGLIMVAPELEDYVSAELHKETMAAKERRKLREERTLARPKK